MIVYCTTINSTIQYANDNSASLLKGGEGLGHGHLHWHFHWSHLCMPITNIQTAPTKATSTIHSEQYTAWKNKGQHIA